MTSVCFSQNNQISLDFDYGTSINNLKSPSSLSPLNYSFRQLENINNLGMSFQYKYKIIKKHNLFLSTGVSFSKSKFFFKILDNHPHYIADVFINKNYLTLTIIGFSKEFLIYNGKIKLVFSYSRIKRFFFKTVEPYSSNYLEANEPNIKYKYSYITIFDNQPIKPAILSFFLTNPKLNLQLKFNTFNEKTFLNIGFKYSKKFNFDYNFSYNIQYYNDSNPTIITNYSYLGQLNSNMFIHNNFASLTFGISHYF